MKDEIIEFTEAVIDKLNDLDDIIDKSLEPIKDYTDTFGDLIAPIKTFTNIFSLSKKMAFKSFIKNYSKCLTTDYVLDEKEKLKLESYFKKRENVHWVSDIIDSAIQAKSLKSSAILGLVAGRIIKEKTSLNDIDIILVNSLKEMTDIDIENFVELYSQVEIHYSGGTSSLKTIYDFEIRTKEFYDLNNWNGKTKIERSSLDLTVEKLKRTGALSYGEGGMDSYGNAKGAFMISLATKELMNLIRKINSKSSY